ncbi:MAG: hypothetical protein AB7O62_17120 [Pirellulales bacterium]
MRGPTEHTIHPLLPGKAANLVIEHDEFDAIEYELYIPAGIWTHGAVQEFVAEPLQIEGGATISKGATGVWRGEQEETHVIRIVIRRDIDQREKFFDRLQQRVGELMARLAEWPVSTQRVVMFTSKQVKVGTGLLRE